MKLVKIEAGKWVFGIPGEEMKLLQKLLTDFPKNSDPLIPQGEVQPASNPEHAQLLAEALAEHRLKNHQLLEQLLKQAETTKEANGWWLVAWSVGELDLLLQTLNEVRVGCWQALGCPDPDARQAIKISTATIRFHWAMEVSGLFQGQILAALEEAP